MTIAVHEVTPTNLAAQCEYAARLSDAGLLPDAFKRKPADILVALAIADDMGESPWTVMSEMAVISGRPSFSAKFMAARVRKAGHRLRQTFDGTTARAVIVRSDDPGYEHVAEWDEAKARAHDLWGKGHWRKNPALMLQNRALSEVVRLACYEVMSGVGYTPDEVEDFAPTAEVRQASRPSPAATVDDAVQAAQAVTDGPMTTEQGGRIRDLMASCGLTRSEVLDLASVTVGRTLKSAADLTEGEAALLIASLAEAQLEHVDEATGEIVDAELLPAEEPEGWQ